MKKYNKFLDIIILCGGAFMFINYFSYLMKLFVYSEGTLPYIVAFGIVTVLPLLFFLHKKKVLSKIFGRIYPIVRTIFAFGLVFYTVSFLMLCGFILDAEHNAPHVNELPENTVVVTLGAKVNANGKPGKILKRRLDTTYELLSENETLRCVVSGGQGRDEPVSEAESMRNYLVERGIDPGRIIMENRATSTIENIENTLKLLEDNGGYGGFAVVTTNFHLPRAKFLCLKLGVDMNKAYFYSAPNSGRLMLYTILVREYMSYCKLFVLGY